MCGCALSRNDVHGGYSLVAPWVLLSSCAEFAPVYLQWEAPLLRLEASPFAAEVIFSRCDVRGFLSSCGGVTFSSFWHVGSSLSLWLWASLELRHRLSSWRGWELSPL